MKAKKRWRYYCDFCKKSGGSKYWMEIHEKHCTMNPDRVCRMCELLGEEQGNMYAAKYLFSGIDNSKFDFMELDKEGEKVFAKAREIYHNCPACLLSALRQHGLHLMVTFDYKAESKAVFGSMSVAAPGY